MASQGRRGQGRGSTHDGAQRWWAAGGGKPGIHSKHLQGKEGFEAGTGIQGAQMPLLPRWQPERRRESNLNANKNGSNQTLKDFLLAHSH